LTVGHFCPNAPLCQGQDKSSASLYNSIARAVAYAPSRLLRLRFASQSKGRLTINRWGIYSATVGVRGLDKTLAFARSGTPARLSRLNPLPAGTHASIRGTPPLRSRGRDLLTGGLRGKKRFALLRFLKNKI
jgi:hypothetical protein